MAWTRLACVFAALLVLQAPRSSALRSVREKQVKLEDIERDNLQSELLKQRPLERPESPYHQHHHQQQHQQQQQEHEPEQAYHPQHYQQQQQQHPQQQHYRFEQPAAPQQHHHLPAQHHHLQQQHLLYQAAASAAPAAPIVPTHVMYLLMPNGNVAAFQIAPHPNHIQAYYTPSGKAHLQHQQMSLGTLFHQHASIPMAYLQPQPHQLQQQVHQQVQYVPAALPSALASASAQGGQRYHPTVHHQPTLAFNSPQAHQLHAQHFRELSGEPSAAHAHAAHATGPEISTYSQPAEQPQQQPIQQSHKSLFGAGVKATASPPLKGSFSTQTGQSYANFRQYG